MPSVFDNLRQAAGQPKKEEEAIKRQEKTRVLGISKMMTKLTKEPKLLGVQTMRAVVTAKDEESFLSAVAKISSVMSLPEFSLAIIYVKCKYLFSSVNAQITMKTIPREAKEELDNIISDLTDRATPPQVSKLKAVAKKILKVEKNEWAHLIKLIDITSDKGGMDISRIIELLQSKNAEN